MISGFAGHLWCTELAPEVLHLERPSCSVTQLTERLQAFLHLFFCSTVTECSFLVDFDRAEAHLRVCVLEVISWPTPTLCLLVDEVT